MNQSAYPYKVLFAGPFAKCKIMLVGKWDGPVEICANYAQFFEETRRAPKNLVCCPGNRNILHSNVLQTIERHAQDRPAPIPNARFAYLII